jgi:hypothetical protein
MISLGQRFCHPQLAWGVLTHNLWMLARMRKPKQKTQQQALPLRKAA